MKSRIALVGRSPAGRSCSSAPDAGVGATAAGHPVRAGGELPCRDDAGRLLEHRGPVRDRPGRPGRGLRRRELRQQVPGRGRRLHGHRPRRHLRRGGGDRAAATGRTRPTPRAPADTSPEAAIATAAYDTLDRPAAAARRQPDDPRRRLRRLPGRHPGRHGEGGRDRRRRSRPPRRCSRCARTTAVGAAPRSRTSACPHPGPASGNPARAPCSGSAYPGCGRSRSRAPRSSGPTAPTP